MAQKVFENEEKVTLNEQRVKQLVRTLAATTDATHDAIQSVDAELSKWVNDGWRFYSATYIGTSSDGPMFLYVLTKD